eukprot:TRINITY_DN60306_c0_g1_i1.p1 TRINITY_DN60306_c0_g1~~TRINITY_DN60306_c0_g1_i1.p1  ORF type:complete len:824 (+),score=172.33 TRINITY_DN60306_c0_g1_i1:102-2474(+)
MTAIGNAQHGDAHAHQGVTHKELAQGKGRGSGGVAHSGQRSAAEDVVTDQKYKLDSGDDSGTYRGNRKEYLPENASGRPSSKSSNAGSYQTTVFQSADNRWKFPLAGKAPGAGPQGGDGDFQNNHAGNRQDPNPGLAESQVIVEDNNIDHVSSQLVGTLDDSQVSEPATSPADHLARTASISSQVTDGQSDFHGQSDNTGAGSSNYHRSEPDDVPVDRSIPSMSSESQANLSMQYAKMQADINDYYRSHYMPQSVPAEDVSGTASESQADIQRRYAEMQSHINQYYRSQYMPRSVPVEDSSEKVPASQAEIQRRYAKMQADINEYYRSQYMPRSVPAEDVSRTASESQADLQRRYAKMQADINSFYRSHYMQDGVPVEDISGTLPVSNADVQKQYAKVQADLDSYYRSQYLPHAVPEQLPASQADTQRQYVKVAADMGEFYRAQYAPPGAENQIRARGAGQEGVEKLSAGSKAEEHERTAEDNVRDERAETQPASLFSAEASAEKQGQYAKTQADINSYYRGQYIPHLSSGKVPESQADLQRQYAKTAADMGEFYRSQYAPPGIAKLTASQQAVQKSAEKQSTGSKAEGQNRTAQAGLLEADQRGGMAQSTSLMHEKHSEAQGQHAQIRADLNIYHGSDVEHSPAHVPEAKVDTWRQQAQTTDNDYEMQDAPPSVGRQKEVHRTALEGFKGQSAGAKSAEQGRNINDEEAESNELDRISSSRFSNGGHAKIAASMLAAVNSPARSNTAMMFVLTALALVALLWAAIDTVARHSRMQDGLPRYVQPPPAEI